MAEIKTYHELEQFENTLQTADLKESQIHNGLYFGVGLKSPTLGDGSSVEMYFKTPDSALEIHGFPTFSSELAGFVEVRESATVSLSGTVLTPKNFNRNSSNTSTASVRSSPTLTASGTRISFNFIGGGNITSAGGNVTSQVGFILKQGTVYILRYTSSAAANEAKVGMIYHEN